MENTTIKSTSQPKGRFFLTRGDAARLIVSGLGFFIGRAVLFGSMDTIALGFLSALIGTAILFS